MYIVNTQTEQILHTHRTNDFTCLLWESLTTFGVVVRGTNYYTNGLAKNIFLINV